MILCTDITEKEIAESLWSIGDDKAPGVDGFDGYLFKKVWPIIKDNDAQQ